MKLRSLPYAVLSILVATAAKAADQPNILLILADDLGYGDVGIYNPESKVPTPNLDRLAAEGIRFTDAHSPSTVCTPTRYSLLTGRMAFRINYKGVFTGVGGPCLITEDQLTLPQILRNQGYATAMYGKWHIGMTFRTSDGQPVYEIEIPSIPKQSDWREPSEGVARVNLVDFSKRVEDGPLDRGFDHFFGTACCPTTDWLYAFIDGDRIPVPPTALLDREAAGLPVHPYSRDNRRGMIAPDFDLEEVDMLFLKKSKTFLENHVKTRPDQPFFLFHSTQAVHLPSFPGNDFKEKTDAGPHGDFIFQLDHIVGELMKTLNQLGIADNTLVIFTSDNGPEVTSVVNMRADHSHDGARPWRGMKRDQWEGGHRVPFIARWTGKIKPGSKSDQTICLTDIMATCAAITDYELPLNAAEDSFNILPSLIGEDHGKTIRPFTLHQTMKLELAIRRGKWKYLDHQGSGGNNYESRENLKPYILPESAPEAPAQLYNLEEDPGETNNLYFKHPDIVRELKALLDASVESGRSAPLKRS
ncbi:MAG: sulfatase-like hydrolase/transferase [Verrucomicrobia bacterium]|nr:sulfatase-like hydrolase/transferase [Verrucomicrobiota bacterium]